MPSAEFRQGSVITNAGGPLRNLFFITKGSAEVALGNQPFRLNEGDVVGLYDTIGGLCNTTVTAVSDISASSYPCEDFAAVESLAKENETIANLMVNSLCRQLSAILTYKAALKKESDSAYDLIKGIYPLYEKLCNMYAITSKKLPALSSITQASAKDTVNPWVENFYLELKEVEPAAMKGFFCKPGITLGFIRRCIEDAKSAFEACKIYETSLENISKVFLNSGGHDLFALITELHLESINIKGADTIVEAIMVKLNGLMSSMTYINSEQYKNRLASYKDNLAVKRENQEITETPGGSSGVKQNLSDSLNTIVEYSGCEQELAIKFTKTVKEYAELTDRGSSDDVIYRMRKDLGVMFYDVYNCVFLKSLEDPNPGTIIKMFLNFGYVDANLAGPQNAEYLYSIADSVKGNPEQGVYTIGEWLTAIYQGKKEPSRNDFDTDYTAYVHEMKVAGQIDAKEEQRMLADLEGKVRFELENVFPIANKITFGRMSTFCPLFDSDSVQRSLETSLVTPELLKETMDEIRGIDYSAFYRETLYSNPEVGVPKESINIEVLPEFILMPNAGLRGAMWQEIEGRVRTTPARMFLPLFLLTDLKPLVIRLTAEFRWEMCKRIQGSRWSDVASYSLTSEFFGYLQFYRTNRELSSEVKAAIKTELVRAKNVYKGVFVSNYTDWLLYESKGSPRLNKFVRKILFNYCPFPADVREKLSTNPQYADILRQYLFKQGQREQLLVRIIAKINSTPNIEVPQELIDELAYVRQ